HSQTSAAHAQPSLTLGEASYLMAASQQDTEGANGIVQHESALFAVDSTTTSPLSADQRIRIWDSLSFHLDGQTAGAWMPGEMIQDPVFTVGKTSLIAWP